ncbi:hypothetical protein SLA2020_121860 [Shorea laevis]
MSSKTRALVIAALLTMKDSTQQLAKANIRAYSQGRKLSEPSFSALPKKLRDEKFKQSDSEEPLRKIMYLSCWGPN